MLKIIFPWGKKKQEKEKENEEMGTIRKVVGFTVWRDRKEPYDHSRLVGKALEMVDYFRTSQPADWSKSPASRNFYAEIYGSQALAKVDLQGVVVENRDAVWVLGTDANYPDRLAKAVAEGRIFGHEEIVIEEEEVEMETIKTPFGEYKIPKGKMEKAPITTWSKDEFIEMIRLIIREELKR